MKNSFVLAWPTAWLVLLGLYQLDGGRADYSKPWLVALVFFASWFLLDRLLQAASGAKPNPKWGGQTLKGKTPDPGEGNGDNRGKIFQLSDYRADAEEEISSGWVSVYRSEDQAITGMVQSILVSREITTKMTNRHAASFFPSVQGISLELWVPGHQADQAMKILKDHNLIPPEMDEKP